MHNGFSGIDMTKKRCKGRVEKPWRPCSLNIFQRRYLKIAYRRGIWVAQSVKPLTLDLGSGLDFRVVSSSLALGVEPT